MKKVAKTDIQLLPFLLLIFLFIIVPVGITCYHKYIIATREIVYDNCYVRGITYDDKKTLLVVELPDHETLAIVDATIHHSRTGPQRPAVQAGELVRCRWKDGDLGKIGYCDWRKGDVPWR